MRRGSHCHAPDPRKPLPCGRRAPRRSARSAWILTALCLLPAGQPRADLGAGIDIIADSTSVSGLLNSRTPRDLFLEVYINGEPTQTLVSFSELDHKLYANRGDLLQLGLSVVALNKLEQAQPSAERQGTGLKQILVGDGGPKVPLDGIPGLHYHYDPLKQTIDLQLSDSIRNPNVLGRRRPTTVSSSADSGLLINYDAYVQAPANQLSATSLGLYAEQRLFSPLGILDNTGVQNVRRSSGDYVRLDSAWHYDLVDRLSTALVGDAISSSLAWTRSVRLGGFQFRRNFNLRPDLITFPVPQLGGSAAVPSAVDLYVNNVRQLSTQVPSGPFVIDNVPAINGSGLATLVVRDALGRSVSTSLPVYVDSRMLSRGLDSFAFEGGLLRLNYGVRSFDYGGAPAFNGVYRYGLNDALTLEGHAEGSSGLLNSGGGGLVRLGQFGVVNASLSGSVGPTRNGVQAGLGYQLVLSSMSFTAQSSRAYRSYGDLAAIGGSPPPRVFDQATLSIPLFRTQTLGLSYIHLNGNGVGPSQLASVSYSVQLPHSLSLIFNAYQDFDQHATRGLWLGLSFYLGNQTSGFASGGINNGHSNYGASVSKSAPYNGGWEWAAQASRSGASDNLLARGGYLGRYGEAWVAEQHAAGLDNLSLEAGGSLVLMDHSIELSRRIYDSFALVSTDGVAGVPVLHENRLLGRTDSGGHLLVPDLNGYQQNQLAIDGLALPADARIPVNHVEVVPRSQSGVLAHFPIERYVAASVILVDDSGRELPPGTILRLVETGKDFVVGYDGMAFIEDLRDHNHVTARGLDLSCDLSFDYHPDGHGLQTLGPLTCHSAVAATP